MNENQEQLDRIEQLLREGNSLRSQAIALQTESLSLQKSLIEEQRANLAQAAKVNESAMLIQQRARRMTSLLFPALVAALAYVTYLLFSRAAL